MARSMNVFSLTVVAAAAAMLFLSTAAGRAQESGRESGQEADTVTSAPEPATPELGRPGRGGGKR